MSGPGIHGRTHVEGGTDPIPGIGGGGSGITFDTDPQDGTWLFVETTGAHTSGYGIVLEPSDGLFINTAANMQIFTGTAVGITAGGNISLNASSPGANIGLTGTRITLDGGLSHFDLNSTDMQIQQYTGPIKVTVASGSVFTVYKSDGTTKLFEVRDDHTVHIKTGQTITADL